MLKLRDIAEVFCGSAVFESGFVKSLDGSLGVLTAGPCESGTFALEQIFQIMTRIQSCFQEEIIWELACAFVSHAVGCDFESGIDFGKFMFRERSSPESSA